MAIPGPFERIARAGGQKVTIRIPKRSNFSACSTGFKKIFNEAAARSYWSGKIGRSTL